MGEECGFKSYEEAIERFARDGRRRIHFFPELQTQEIVTRAYWEGFIGISWIREDLITPQIALSAVKKWGRKLAYVPAHLQTEEVIEIALKDDPDNSKFIKVKEMFKNALEEALDE